MSTKADLSIDQGATFSATLNLMDNNNAPLDLNGYTANSQMRRWYTSSNSVTFNTSINSTAGTITLELDANITANLHPGRHVYDVDITDGVSITRIVEGRVYVHPAVTKGG